MNYDFIEIGTSDFETLVQSSHENAYGIAVEPVKYYLERLPNKPNVKKLNVAISSSSGFISVYYVPDDIITKNNFPYWLRGCNSVGDYHYQHKLLKIEHLVSIDLVPCITVGELFKNNNVTSVDYLKLDTEGSDCNILNHFYYWGVENQVLPKQILFESNILTPAEEVKNTIKLFSKYYKVIYSNENTLMKLM